jgi:hypothetical protein
MVMAVTVEAVASILAAGGHDTADIRYEQPYRN